MRALADRLTVAELTDLIELESERIELKTGVGTSPVQESLVAFSNSEDGGTILIGVTDDRQVVGRRHDQGTDDKIHEAARSAHDLGRYAIKAVDVEGTQIVAVEVNRRLEGFAQTSNGRVLVRRGGHNVHLVGEDLWTFMSERRFAKFERTATSLGLDDLDDSVMNAVCTAYGWDRDDSQLVDRLSERHLADQTGTLTIAGALLLTNPQATLALRKAQVEIRRYQGAGPDYDRRVFIDGSLGTQITDATKFIVDELGTDLVVSGVHRYDLPKLPEVVIREAIANAVAHRSYETDRISVLVQMRPSQVTITSPGTLPEPVTIETMRAAQAARNPAIIDALRHLQLAEDAGRGIDVMQDSMAAALLDPPRFEEEGQSLVVTLSLTGPITARERGWVADLERNGELNVTDRLLLVHAARGETLTNGQAREILRVDALEARRALHRLRDAGFVVQHGTRGGSYYTLAERIAPAARYRLTQEELAELVLDAVQEHGSIANQEVRALTGLGRDDALALLRGMVVQGSLVAVGERRGRRYTRPPR